MSALRSRPKRLSTLAAIGALVVIALVVHLQGSTFQSHILSSAGQLRGRRFQKLATRANDGNNAIPNWLGHPDSYLNGDYNTLDDKGKAVVTGKTLVCALNSDASAQLFQQSTWTDTSAITNPGLYGWKYSRVQANDEFMEGFNLGSALSALSISEAASDWYQVSTGHFSKGRPNGNDGPVYPATEATYTNVVNVKDGVIIAATNYGPAYTNDRYELNIPADQMVPLKHWSDLMFLAYKKTVDDLHTGSLDGINHVFRFNIQSTDVQTQLVMATGTSGSYDFPPEWPGVTYPIREYQAKAALSVANGKGVAHLLGTHKTQMGIRIIDRVNVFNCRFDDEDHWCMYFHIVDGPLPDEDM